MNLNKYLLWGFFIGFFFKFEPIIYFSVEFLKYEKILSVHLIPVFAAIILRTNRSYLEAAPCRSINHTLVTFQVRLRGRRRLSTILLVWGLRFSGLLIRRLLRTIIPVSAQFTCLDTIFSNNVLLQLGWSTIVN